MRSSTVLKSLSIDLENDLTIDIRYFPRANSIDASSIDDVYMRPRLSYTVAMQGRPQSEQIACRQVGFTVVPMPPTV